MDKNTEWEDIVIKVRQEVRQKYNLYTSLDFGAYIRPENYFVSYIFLTTKELKDARKGDLLKEINEYHKEVMQKNGYPEDAIKDCDFASQEDCDKNCNGNWYYYYK